MRRHLILTTLAILPLAACANGGTGMAGSSAAQPGATAALVDSSGATRGEARFTQLGGGVELTVRAQGIQPAGEHGLHLHAVGKCAAPKFESAGPHWNPTGRQHGTENPAGPHSGDIPNIAIGADGTGTLTFTLPGATLTGGANAVLDTDGTAIVIHATADDYRTDPSGNSGGRIACGVVQPAG